MSEDSNYVCTLDKTSIKKAKDELNEIPEDRLAAVQAFRNWIKAQPHIQCKELDTKLLLRFLRGTKFSQVKAREKFELYLSIKIKFPEYALNIDTHEPVMKKIIESGFVFYKLKPVIKPSHRYIIELPKRNAEGCQVMLCRTEVISMLLGPMKVDPKMLNRFHQLVLYYIEQSEMTQVNGTSFIVDFTGLTLSIMTKLFSSERSKVDKLWMKATPGRYKAFEYYRPGLLIDALLTFYRPFMPKKWISRIKLHDTMETLYKDVPKECLPAEYLPDDYTGPNAGTTQDLIKAFSEKLWAKEFREELLYRTSKAFWIDESKRPKETVTEHFRKLNVD